MPPARSRYRTTRTQTRPRVLATSAATVRAATSARSALLPADLEQYSHRDCEPRPSRRTGNFGDGMLVLPHPDVRPARGLRADSMSSGPQRGSRALDIIGLHQHVIRVVSSNGEDADYGIGKWTSYRFQHAGQRELEWTFHLDRSPITVADNVGRNIV